MAPQTGGWGAAWHVRSSHMNSAGGNKLVGGNPIFTAHSFIHVLLHQWSCGALWSMLLCVSEGCFATLCACVGVCVCVSFFVDLTMRNMDKNSRTHSHARSCDLSVSRYRQWSFHRFSLYAVYMATQTRHKYNITEDLLPTLM